MRMIQREEPGQLPGIVLLPEMLEDIPDYLDLDLCKLDVISIHMYVYNIQGI